MSRVLASYNIKGGVGKTSAAVNLAYLASREGARTLLWDLDPQGGTTFLLRVRPKVKGGGRKLVRGQSDPDDLIKGTDHEGLDLLPADFSYRHMDLALDGTKKPTQRLARVLAPLALEYDYVFLDCPPSVSLVDALLVPVIPGPLSSRTLAQLTDVVADQGKRRPDVLAFFSMVDGRKRLHKEIMEELAGREGVLATAIPAASVVERMGAEREPIAAFAPRSRAAAAYEALWAEVRERLD
jgi:chromosome partitioning protein